MDRWTTAKCSRRPDSCYNCQLRPWSVQVHSPIVEFTTDIGSTMIERSTLSSASTFSIDAISHQDFVADYTDRYTRVPTAGAIGDSIVNHHPLGVTGHQESYAWNFPYANDFVIISYTIKNITTDTIDNFYVGLWSDNVVRNTNYVRPAVGSSYYDSMRRRIRFYRTE